MFIRLIRFGTSLFVLTFTLLATASLRAQADGTQRWAFTTLSTATAGSIVSSPAVAPDGTIYIGVEVGTSTSSSASGRLFALNPSGTQKWVYSAPDWIDSAPAIAADGTIYFGCWDGKLYALRPDGTVRWTYAAGSFIASSPAIGTDGTIYVGAGSDLVAVNPGDGSLKWSFPAVDWVDSSPAVGPDGTIYFGSWDGNIYALRPDGTKKWNYTTGDEVVSSPAVAADGTVYAGSRDAYLYALTPAGALKWRFDTRDTVEASPVLAPDGTVYVTTTGGRLLAFNRDGTEKWRYPAAAAAALSAIYSSPAVRADGSVVFGSSNNAVYAVRADGTLLWRTTIGDWSDSSPVVTGDTIYIGAADKKLYALNSTSGALATDWPQFHREARRTGWQPLGTTPGTSGQLINLSVRTTAGADENTLIVGFAVSGTGTRSLLVRGIGPTLTQFGVTGELGDPWITAFNENAVVAANDNWGAADNVGTIRTTAAAVGAFALPEGSLDAALLRSFSAGPYTVQVAGAGGTTGIALMEAYDASGGTGARLVNISARSAVGTGTGISIAGFVVRQDTRAVLIRAVGPGLAPFGVPSTLANPQLKIFQGAQLVAENDNWSVATNAAAVEAVGSAVGAFALPNGSLDAAMLMMLPPGNYTAQVSGVNNDTGVALIEVYEVP
ncbi:MAG: PQQ-binding-like beta-propeller repeat protein [Opitutaceae bacterium]|nr:PQQ-binding-like beta-propeller repeat protein [Opitutaceae bacterium]